MPTPVAMPKLGLTMAEGKVVAWPIPLGAPVAKGQVVLIIESDKAEVEVEATGSGVLRHLYADPEEVLACGSLLAAITEDAESPFDAEAFYKEHHNPEEGALANSDQSATASGGDAGARSEPQASDVHQGRTRAAIVPAARALAKKLKLDPEKIPGTGPKGRVTKDDVAAYAERRKALIEVAPGVELEAPCQGKGRRVLLLPGFGTDISAFARQVPALAERYEVQGVNPRGVGLSDAPEEAAYTIEGAAEDAASLIDEPAHLVGASLGAGVAIEVALRHPAKVRSLCLVTPFLTATPRLLSVIDLWCAAADQGSPALVAKTILPWLFSDATLGDDRARARVERGLADIAARVAPEALKRAATGLRAWSGEREGALSTLALPTLVIAGGRDLMTPAAEAVAADIPGAKCVVVSDAGHAVALEAADAVNEALLNHLTGA